MLCASLLLAHAGTVIEGHDGRSDPPPRPAFTLWAEPAPTGHALVLLRDDLDRAWDLRADLLNEAAAERLEDLLPRMVPTLDEGTGDLYADALYLQGVLQLDESAGFGAPGDAVVVGGQPVPRPWVQAMAIRPDRPPRSPGEAFRKQVYEHVRTVRLTAGGTELDLTGPGEVRVDGVRVDGPVVLLPGTHTLSWHPVGQPVEVAVLDAEGIEQLARDLDVLRYVVTRQAELPERLREHIWTRLGTPSVTITDGEESRRLRTLDDPVQPRATTSLGVVLGASGWFQRGFARLDPCGTASADGPLKVLAPLGLRADRRGEGWFAELGLGALTALTPESAWSLEQSATCSDGSSVDVAMARALPRVGVAAGPTWNTPLGTLGPSLGVGTTLAHLELDAGLRARGERFGFLLHAGPSLSRNTPAWRAGLELSVWQGVGW